MLVREVMTHPVVTVHPGDTVRRVIRVLHEHDITAVPVLDDTGRLVGIVSEMDLLRGEFDPDPRASMRPLPSRPASSAHRVEDVMTRQVVTVTETTDAATLTDLLVSKRIKSLPVVAGDHVVGMISRRDLIAALARPDEDLRSDVIAALREQFPSGPRWDVVVRDGIAEIRATTGETEEHDRIAGLIARTVPGVVRVTRPG
ncbi:CBS domain-containing protein [Streptosporangium becharense]|uniref:CBS domain-containing protein n=1 Tax=Streptosporangium becharense TaxID=1816182 RepID=A0A7W9IB55_9ACTN|nr:CBS domain-containing protein [Streptosporangium becharense]MBB2910748.1 CBS domain-containing protein [Streptosporangium becharense]MBB5817443.1 CBS domain-containing protein [Streptosporangium becharense]